MSLIFSAISLIQVQMQVIKCIINHQQIIQSRPVVFNHFKCIHIFSLTILIRFKIMYICVATLSGVSWYFEGMYRATHIITLLQILGKQCPNRGYKIDPITKRRYCLQCKNTHRSVHLKQKKRLLLLSSVFIVSIIHRVLLYSQEVTHTQVVSY